MRGGAIVTGFALLAAAGVGLEAAARRSRAGLATLSQVGRLALARRGARMAVLAGWLWLGWHLFVR